MSCDNTILFTEPYTSMPTRLELTGNRIPNIWI